MRKPKKGKEFHNPITPDEAIHDLLNNIEIGWPKITNVPIEKATRRVLAENIKSPRNIPLFDKTIFDSYAIRSEDTQGITPGETVSLEIKGRLFPKDHPSSLQLSKGEAAYTATGAPIPEGANAAVRIEEVKEKEGKIFLNRTINPGENVARKGEDVQKGSLVMSKGCVLRPQDTAILAGLGLKKLKVYADPKLAVIPVGDELVEIGSANKKGIPANYSLLITGLAQSVGADSAIRGIVPDNVEEIAKEVSKATDEAEIVATIGGCSVGENDSVPGAINSLEDPGVVVHGVSISPGHVMGAGVINGKPIVMLPGHAVSCTAGFYQFIYPLINKFRGLKPEMFPKIKARLSTNVQAKSKHAFIRVSLKKDVNGDLVATPIHGGSNVLSTLVEANAFTILSPNSRYEKGEKLEFKLLSPIEYCHING